MNIALATRKALIATVFVPMIAMTAVAVEPVAGLSGAEAQQQSSTGGNNGGGNRGGGNRGEGGENPNLLQQSNCLPGTAAPLRGCQKKVVAVEQQDCSCEVNYRIVGGQRVAVKDCYYEVNEEIRYCTSDSIALR